MRALLLLLPLVATACVNGVEGGPAAANDARTEGQPDASEGEGEGEPVQGPDDVEDATALDDADAQPPAEEDPDGDGAVLVDEPAVAPAEAAQVCSEWTDCGPNFADPNSGFDCVSGSCACDATGQWAVACAGISGIWSPQDCFCYVGTSPMPGTLAVPPQDAVNGSDDDVTCWWRWKDTGCDPDRWIDTSYYERVCDSHGCNNEYVYDGYYEDGDCYGRWIKRCSNGYEYW